MCKSICQHAAVRITQLQRAARSLGHAASVPKTCHALPILPRVCLKSSCGKATHGPMVFRRALASRRRSAFPHDRHCPALHCQARLRALQPTSKSGLCAPLFGSCPASSRFNRIAEKPRGVSLASHSQRGSSPQAPLATDPRNISWQK